MGEQEWDNLVKDLHRAGNNLRHEGFLVDAATADAAGSAITNLLSSIADPIAVHANMLRGTIAKPTVDQIVHLYGVDALVKALAPVIVREADATAASPLAPEPANVTAARVLLGHLENDAMTRAVSQEVWDQSCGEWQPSIPGAVEIIAAALRAIVEARHE